MRGSKILITGPTGQIATPIARALAADNEVWGIARFTDPAARQCLEAAGIRCETVNLAAGDFNGVPKDFDYVLNLAVAKSGSWDKDLAANAESVGLLMAHCREAKAFLHCSSAAVYDPPDDDPRSERSALGDNHKPLFPTYSISKIAGEVVARSVARVIGLPTTIARLNVPYGDNGGWPFYHMEMMLAGIPIPVPPGEPARYNPIHEDDIIATIPSCFRSRRSRPPPSTGAVTRPSACRSGVTTSARWSAKRRSSSPATKRCAATPPPSTGCTSSSVAPRSTGETEFAAWRPSSTRNLSAFNRLQHTTIR